MNKGDAGRGDQMVTNGRGTRKMKEKQKRRYEKYKEGETKHKENEREYKKDKQN